MQNDRVKIGTILSLLLLILSGGSATSLMADNVTAAITLGSNKATYLFLSNGQYARISAGRKGYDKGYPTKMPGGWKGIPSSWYGKINAALPYQGSTKAYMWSGGDYLRMNNVTVDQGYPTKMPGGWKNMPSGWAGNVDAALYFPPWKKHYFFKGNEYVRITGVTVDKGYPAKLPGGWKGMPNEFVQGIDAATFREGHVYMFKGNKFIRFTGTQMDPGYPKLVSASWPEGSSIEVGAASKPTPRVFAEKKQALQAPTTGLKAAPRAPARTVTAEPVKPFTATFENLGLKPVKLIKLDPNTGMSLGQPPITVKNKFTINVADSNIGDVYEVLVVDGNKDISGWHKNIFVSDPNQHIYVYGQRPLEDQKLSFTDLSQVDSEANFYGVDLGSYDPRNVNSSFSATPIFESLQLDHVDYTVQSKNIVKRGFYYSDVKISKGSSKTRMAHGYGEFSTALSVNVSGTFPLGKAPASGSVGVGYSEMTKEGWSTTDVFAFTKEHKSLYKLDVKPEEASLDARFVNAVMRAKTQYDLKKVRETFGTHYAKTVFYGGEYLTYARFSEQEYSKLQSKGVDIKASVQTSAKTVKDTSKTNQAETSSKGGNGGSVGISYKTVEGEGYTNSDGELKYRAVGGYGSFDSWQIDDSNVVPIGVELAPMYELLTAKVFKNGADPAELKRKQAILKKDYDVYVKSLPRIGKTPLPTKYINVTLTNMRVTEHVDDLQQQTRGTVSAAIFGTMADPWPARKRNYFADPKSKLIKDGYAALWQSTGWSYDFRNKPGFSKSFSDRTITFAVKATKENKDGSFVFPPLMLRLAVDVTEKDDCCGDERAHKAQFFPLTTGRVFETVNVEARSFTTHAEKGKIKGTFQIQRMPVEFDALKDL